MYQTGTFALMTGVTGGHIEHPRVQALMLERFADEYTGEISPEVRKDLAYHVKVSHATISRWVDGRTRISSRYWKDLAQVAGMTVPQLRDYLTGEQAATEVEAPGDNTVETLREEVRRLARAVDLLEVQVASIRVDVPESRVVD